MCFHRIHAEAMLGIKCVEGQTKQREKFRGSWDPGEETDSSGLGPGGRGTSQRADAF